MKQDQFGITELPQGIVITRRVPFKLLFPDSKAPERKRATDAGMDLFAHSFSYTESGVCNVHLGVAVNIPEGFVGLLRPRSSVRNYSYSVASSCIIDAGYTGELVLPLREHPEPVNGGKFLCYHEGDKCAQLVILPLPRFEWVQVEELEQTDRNTQGFGASGK